MPVHPVYRNNQIIGYQWGKSGKKYYGKGAKGKAEKQGQAIHASGYLGKDSARKHLSD